MRAIITILLVWAGLIPVAAPLHSQVRTESEVKEMLRQAYSAWAVDVQLDRSEYIRGEQIFARVTFTSNQPQRLPWSNEVAVSNCLRMWRDSEGGTELAAFRLGMGEADDSVRVTEKSFTAELTKTFFVSPRPSECDFRCLPAGIYVVKFDHGIESQPVLFTVVDPPDSVAHLWPCFNAVCSMVETRRHLSISGQVLADSTRRLLEVFLQRPVGSTWRFEAMVAGLWTYGVCRESWSELDSLACLQALNSIGQEPRANPGYVLSCARASLCAGLDDDATIAALERIAPAIEGEENRQLLLSYRESIRLRNEKWPIFRRVGK